MSTDLLKRCGEALYGPRWQSELAREMGVSTRTMRRWLASPKDMPAGVFALLPKLCQQHAETLMGLARELHRAAADSPEEFARVWGFKFSPPLNYRKKKKA